jgi:zinc transport system substrate-binding protein
LTENSDGSVLSETGNEYIAPQTTLIGAGGKEEWTFKALKEGTTIISMGYSRPWESTPPVETFSLTVVVKPTVVTTTSLIASIVEQVGGDKVHVANIIPPAQSPEHFDVKPSDIQMLAYAKLFLMHYWQGELFTQMLIQSADNPDLEVVSLNIPGNWMTPTVQAEAVGDMTSALADIDPDNAAYYQNNAQSQQQAIAAKGAELKARLDVGNVSQYSVICGDQISGFVVWTGLNVVASYPRPEDFSPQKLQELIDQGKQAGVALVIDNLQSGSPDAGVLMANAIGAVQVTLSNFPGGLDNTETWEKAIEKNIDLLLDAIARYEQGG